MSSGDANTYDNDASNSHCIRNTTLAISARLTLVLGGERVWGMGFAVIRLRQRPRMLGGVGLHPFRHRTCKHQSPEPLGQNPETQNPKTPRKSLKQQSTQSPTPKTKAQLYNPQVCWHHGWHGLRANRRENLTWMRRGLGPGSY